MLFFHPRFVRTFDDLPGHIGLLIHAWNGCNMRCYGCHNYDELIAVRPDARRLRAAQVISRIADSGGLFDVILLSGGEFLLAPLTEIREMLQQFRRVYAGKIVVYTNGTFPRKLELLLHNGDLDGAHLDIKLPYHLLDPHQDAEVYEAILGVVPTERKRRDLLSSLEIVIVHDSPYSRLRTVRYPLLSDEYFEHIHTYVESLRRKHRSSVPYDLNPYYAPEALRAHRSE